MMIGARILRSASRLSAIATPALSAGVLGSFVRCHCEVPCGIFDDPMRVTLIKEDAATIRKSMLQITELSGQSTPLAFNQASMAPPARVFSSNAMSHAHRTLFAPGGIKAGEGFAQLPCPTHIPHRLS
jgi:hypothetical protein